MTIRIKNIIWASFLAVIFYVYYTTIAKYWLGQKVIDPLVVNLIAFPFILGVVSLLGLSGTVPEKIIFLFLITLVPGLIVFQNGDSAKPGLQWFLLAALHAPYFSGILVIWSFQNFIGKYKAKSDRS